MLTNALGQIEVLGLPAAIEAADVAVKAANVRLIGYETTDGAGMVTVKIEGQVSSVQSAVAAARAAASQVTRVFATSVIPRPNAQLGDVVLAPATVGLGAPTSVDAAARAAAERSRADREAAARGSGPDQTRTEEPAAQQAEKKEPALAEKPVGEKKPAPAEKPAAAARATGKDTRSSRTGSRQSHRRTSARSTTQQAEQK